MAKKTLLITGASSGIGAATARAAAAAGWCLVLAARSHDKLDALAMEIGADRALAIACDVTREDEIASAIAQAADFGRLEAVFANAGIGATVGGAEGGETANWRQMIDINIWGLCLTVKHALPELKKVKGHMILTGSRVGTVALKGSVYGATKWFVHGFGRNLALEMNEWGGRCTVIAPGMVDTPLFDEPKPYALAADDVARAVVYALEQPARVNIAEVIMTPVL